MLLMPVDVAPLMPVDGRRSSFVSAGAPFLTFGGARQPGTRMLAAMAQNWRECSKANHARVGDIVAGAFAGRQAGRKAVTQRRHGPDIEDGAGAVGAEALSMRMSRR